MGKLLENEKQKQSVFKAASLYFSNEARVDGVYKTKPRPYCLPASLSHENLFPEIRQTAIDFFNEHEIKWHDAQNRKPSNHMCDSQVCCVNFLFPFSNKPKTLAEVFRPIFPSIRQMLPVEDGQFVSFEWIGKENYLRELVSHNRKRTRGANFTSADAIVMFERIDGKKQIVLIEWKYTESYSTTDLTTAKSGKNRTDIYRWLIEKDDCLLSNNIRSHYDALFFEPFYQFMRQQFLAHEMEQAHELGADVVSLLHIAPACNADFRKVTSRKLTDLGETAIGVWTILAKTHDRFLSVSTEALFGSLTAAKLPEIGAWLDYINARYSWIRTNTA